MSAQRHVYVKYVRRRRYLQKEAGRRLRSIRQKQLAGFRSAYGRWKLANVRTGGYLGRELKYYDVKYDESNLATTFAAGTAATTDTFGLFCPTVGTSADEREGRKCTLTQIHVVGSVFRAVEHDADDVRKPSAIFVCLVRDNQCNGATINPSQVYLNSDNVEFQFRNLEYVKRFTILATKRFVLYDTAAMTRS